MTASTSLEALTLADDLTLTRMGYGAMQLAGPGVFGPPKDRDAAIAVLREAVAFGVTHIDTSDFYGPRVVNEIIREALRPYPEGLHVVTKVGARRGEDGSWIPSLTPESLVQQVHENLAHLGLDVLDVVNLRVGAADTPGGDSLEGSRPKWVGDLTPSDFRPDVSCTSQKLPTLTSPTVAPDLRPAGGGAP